MSTAPRIERQPWHDRLYLPSYRYVDVARLVQTTPQTVARWRRAYSLLDRRAAQTSYAKPLSYFELITIAFIAAFRRTGVELDNLRQVHESLRGIFNDDYPFTLLDFKTRAPLVLAHLPDGHLFEYGIVSWQGRRDWNGAILAQFEQFDYDEGRVLRWYPRGRDSAIVVDARIAFGSPIIKGAGILTYILKQRYVAGETLEETADDFGISIDQLREALLFEGAQKSEL